MFWLQKDVHPVDTRCGGGGQRSLYYAPKVLNILPQLAVMTRLTFDVGK